jgi:hypothetical protein
MNTMKDSLNSMKEEEISLVSVIDPLSVLDDVVTMME